MGERVGVGVGGWVQECVNNVYLWVCEWLVCGCVCEWVGRCM